MTAPITTAEIKRLRTLDRDLAEQPLIERTFRNIQLKRAAIPLADELEMVRGLLKDAVAIAERQGRVLCIHAIDYLESVR